MNALGKKTILLLLSIGLTFVAYRLYLYWDPSSNLYIAGYNIHHLYVGLVLIVIGAIPAILYQKNSLWIDFSIIIFGIGLASTLDQIIYLITTDGSDTSYLLPISFFGGLIAIVISLVYIVIIYLIARKN